MRHPAAVLLMLSLSLAGAAPATAHDAAHDDHPLGTVDFPVSCSAAAQPAFNRATALLHHMTYPQAREAYRQVAAIDPHCAMARWGVAMTLFQPLWPTRPSPTDLEQGWALVQEAEALGAPTERERLFIAAAGAFFSEPASPDYWLRIRRWAEAMDELYAAFPADPEAEAFYALSLLATVPADAVTHERADRAAEVLLRVYRDNPDHPGAMHYLVHANDTPGRERELLEITRKYEDAAPDNPHALHMPTHIYTRLGDWDGVIRGNLRAADAALRYPAGQDGEYVWDEFPHAIEYLLYAYLQTGAYDDAAAQLARLQSTARLEPSFKTAFHLASTRARYALERHAWSEAEQIAPREPATLPWDRFPWPEAIAQFAHGLGAVHLGKFDECGAVIERLEALESAAHETREELFARNIRILRLELSSWLAHANGESPASVALMQEAAALEAATPKHAVTPAPTIPAQELLGDLLMAQHEPAQALAAYRQALERYPNRFNSLRGMAQAQQAMQAP